MQQTCGGAVTKTADDFPSSCTGPEAYMTVGGQTSLKAIVSVASSCCVVGHEDRLASRRCLLAACGCYELGVPGDDVQMNVLCL